MNSNEVKVGDKVVANGFPGTITAICEWSRATNDAGQSDVMVEVRLASGTVCVSAATLVRQ